MKSLEERDRALIEAAGAAIRRNYDEIGRASCRERV